MRKLDGVTKLLFFGFPVGARGKWPSCNDRVLRRLGVSKSRMERFAKLVARRTLAWSLDVLRDFNMPTDDGPARPVAGTDFLDGGV